MSPPSALRPETIVPPVLSTLRHCLCSNVCVLCRLMFSCVAKGQICRYVCQHLWIIYYLRSIYLESFLGQIALLFCPVVFVLLQLCSDFPNEPFKLFELAMFLIITFSMCSKASSDSHWSFDFLQARPTVLLAAVCIPFCVWWPHDFYVFLIIDLYVPLYKNFILLSDVIIHQSLGFILDEHSTLVRFLSLISVSSWLILLTCDWNRFCAFNDLRFVKFELNLFFFII